MTVQDLPALNASLNATSTVLILCGYACIRARRRTAHKRLMLSAVFTSACFLVTYLVYHTLGKEAPFGGRGLVRYAYFAMLISHVLLAIAIVPMVLITVRHGLKDRLEKHVRIARWTFRLWLYVSVTGVLVYLCLYWPPLVELLAG